METLKLMETLLEIEMEKGLKFSGNILSTYVDIFPFPNKSFISE